ncbi:MAG: hypothetical protein AABZ39_07945, partial [Spirochaetota bacterium]
MEKSTLEEGSHEKPARVKVSLRIKYALAVLLVTTITLFVSFLATGYTMLERNQVFLSEALLKETVRLLDYFSSTVRDALIYDDEYLLTTTFDKIKTMENIDYAVVFDQRTNVRLHSEVAARHAFSASNNAIASLYARTNMTVNPQFDPKRLQTGYVLAFPLLHPANGKRTGLLLVKYTTSKMRALVHFLRRDIIRNMSIALC